MSASFTDLNLTKPLRRALEQLGHASPTPIQEKSFPVLMSGVDAVGIAQTGTGKTLAYLLPLLRQLDYSEQKQPRILVLVPTRELVVQVADAIAGLAAFMQARVVPVYGATNINTQKRALNAGADIIVATPGRLIDLVLTRHVQLSHIKKLVIDEADEMLNLGFRPQLMRLLDVLPAKRQSILFSATLSEEVEEMITQHFKNPVYIELVARGTPADKIVQLAYAVPNFYTKINLLRFLLTHEKTMTRALLFVKNKQVAARIEENLGELLEETGVIHSNKTQPNRFAAVKRFQEGSIRLLVATDVVARGIDFEDVTHVINFDLPSEPETYVHRIGRTGRAGKQGTAISFVVEKEAPYAERIEELMRMEIGIAELPDAVEVSDELLPEEAPPKRDKSLRKLKKNRNAHRGVS